MPRGNPHDPNAITGNTAEKSNNGTDKVKSNNGKGADKTVTTTDTVVTDHPGHDAQGSANVAGGRTPGATGIYKRSARANEVAQNTVKNKHLNGTGVPGNSDHSNNGNGNGGNSGNSGGGGNNGNADNSGNKGGNSAWKPEEEFMYYYHPDHLGSTGYVTDEDGLLYEHIEYFPFGETWVQEANNTERTPYLYTGKELDEDTQLYYYGARYYDPRTSVWQSADPILNQYLGGVPNEGVYNSLNISLYSYSFNNPIIFNDPDGRSPEWWDNFKSWWSSPGPTADMRNNMMHIGKRHAELARQEYEAGNISYERYQFEVERAKIYHRDASGLPATKGDLVVTGVEVAGFLPMTKMVGPASSVAKNVTRFKHGELFGHTIQTKKGPVDLLAETVIKGDTLILKDIAVFGRKGSEALTGLQKDIFRGAAELKKFAKEQGFKRLEITGRRVETSSSAKPGHDVNLGWDL